MTWVLDASAALAWVFERSNPDEAARALAHLEKLAVEEAIVPELWHLEVANALVVAQRREVISTARAHGFLARLGALPIQTHSATFADRRERLFDLGREHGLSAYDATYLDLALQTGAALATFDRRLADAADKAGVARA
jgi:predicted nucleic acid-binding protein